MSISTNLLFLSDPKAFMEIVTDADAENRFKKLKGSFEDLVICEITRYGFYNDEAMISPLQDFYRSVVMEAPENRRLAIYMHIAGLVENTSFVTVNAFLPFIAEDNSRGIVATAAIDYVSLGSLTHGDPMSRVNDIIGMIESGQLENEGAAFGALLNLGDDRVCNLLVPLRATLDNHAVREATNCATGFIYSATAEAYLDWLEGLEGDDRDGVFGLVASGLALLRKQARITDVVFTGRRPFPTKGVSKAAWARVRAETPYADYVKRIAPRMRALERSEPPPRVMPHVLAEWGITPVTNPAQMFPLGDRSKAPTPPTIGWAEGSDTGLTTPAWLEMSSAEIHTYREQILAAYKHDREDAVHALRHLMNLTLFLQFDRMRSLIDEDVVSEETFRRYSYSDFFVAYLFGLAANYTTLAKLDRQDDRARAALHDVYRFAFGPDQGTRVIAEENQRTPEQIGAEYSNGMVSAENDMNSVLVIFQGGAGAPSSSILGGLFPSSGTRFA